MAEGNISDRVPGRDDMIETDELMTPAEVAQLFRVDPKTVGRWADTGKLRVIRTLGGHRRFLAAEVLALAGRPDAPEMPQQRPRTD
jgi:excisionase family DNA binding protein